MRLADLGPLHMSPVTELAREAGRILCCVHMGSFFLVTEMKECPEGHKKLCGKPAQPKDSRNECQREIQIGKQRWHHQEWCCSYPLCSQLSLLCCTAEWLSSAVGNTAGKAQCCNPGLFIAKAKLSFSKFEAKEADAFKPE